MKVTTEASCFLMDFSHQVAKINETLFRLLLKVAIKQYYITKMQQYYCSTCIVSSVPVELVTVTLMCRHQDEAKGHSSDCLFFRSYPHRTEESKMSCWRRRKHIRNSEGFIRNRTFSVEQLYPQSSHCK